MIAQIEPRISLRPFAERVKQDIPAFRATVNNAYALRGETPKGSYETRVFLNKGEIRTTFLRKGANPLQSRRLLCRTGMDERETGFAEHIAVIQANEEKLPWVQKETDPGSGDESVTILPFGKAEKAPRVVVRTSGRTGIVSLEVCDAREMSPAEARLVGEALIRACEITANPPVSFA